MQDILINWSPQETRVAIVENGAVQELHLERALERGLVGNIYLGKVARVLPGMQSAFIDIGLERAAFLHVADVSRATARRATTTGRARAAAADRALVFEGQTLTVQVIKDPIGTKGARLSTQISIAGRLLVFLPQDNHIGISQKIGSPELREQLRARMTVLAQLGEGGEPAATRAQAAAASSCAPTPRRRATRSSPTTSPTCARPGRASASARFESPPGTLLHQDLSLAERVLRDLADERTQTIRIDSQRAVRGACASSATSTRRARSASSQHYDGERPIFDLFTIDEEIAKALARRVDLKSGGYLIIDQTEALTTIDVNTGGFVGARNFDDTIFKTNLEAGQAIARQLRLRNLGGIIIVDFIDMAREEHRTAVLAELKQAAGARPHQDHGQRLHPARPGRDDAQAHPRVAGPHAVRAVPDLRGPRRGEDGAQRLPRHPARDPARGAPVQSEGVPRRRLAPRWSRCCSTRRASTWPASRTSSASRSRSSAEPFASPGAVRHRPHLKAA